MKAHCALLIFLRLTTFTLNGCAKMSTTGAVHRGPHLPVTSVLQQSVRPLNDVTAAHGDDVTLQCSIRKPSSFDVLWLMRRQLATGSYNKYFRELQDNHSKFSIKIFDKVSGKSLTTAAAAEKGAECSSECVVELQIRNVQSTDNGYYACVASEKQGESTDEVTLLPASVIQPERATLLNVNDETLKSVLVEEPANQNVAVGDTTTIPCNVARRTGTEVVWYRIKGEEVTEIDRDNITNSLKYEIFGVQPPVLSKSECRDAPCKYALSINDVQISDSGLYFCGTKDTNSNNNPVRKAKPDAVERSREVRAAVINLQDPTTAGGDQVKQPEKSGFDSLQEFIASNPEFTVVICLGGGLIIIGVPVCLVLVHKQHKLRLRSYPQLKAAKPVGAEAKSKQHPSGYRTHEESRSDADVTHSKPISSSYSEKKEESESSEASDDEEGHLHYKVGDYIKSRYKIIKALGEGQFSKVCEVIDTQRKDKPHLAIKVIRAIEKYRDAAEDEINVLKKMAKKDPQAKHLWLPMVDWFDYQGHICILFPMLAESVFDFLKDNNYYPYPVHHVRHITYQLIYAVKFLHDNKLTHTDLKPENMLLVDTSYKREHNPDIKKDQKVLHRSDARLIDFGSAVFDHEHHSTIIQTRHYRAPEVILELGWSQPCDIWSIGCIMFELYTGDPLFLTHDTKEHLAMMQRILGPIPSKLIKASKTKYFVQGRLDWDQNSDRGRRVREKCKRLPSYLLRDDEDHRDCLKLMSRFLDYDPSTRYPLSKALDDKFFKKLPSQHRVHELEKGKRKTPANDKMSTSPSPARGSSKRIVAQR